LGAKAENDMYWFVETVTSRDLIEEWQANGMPVEQRSRTPADRRGDASIWAE
jgi:hypothetical protein